MIIYKNLYIKIICIVILTIASSLGYSQNPIKGKVVLATNTKEPVSNVRVTLSHNVSGAIVAYSFSKVDGTFELKVTGKSLPLKLEVSAMGYQAESLLLDEWPNGLLLIAIKEGLIELNEVKVVAPVVSIKGDTLNFMTNKLSKEGDRSIEEVIKRIPGIEVAASGEIRYNDTPINALYIDGKNILDEKYSLATKNLKPSLISMVQIFENHQPIKALKGFTPSESAAVNLVLSPEAKAEWIASANLAIGVGAPLFYSAPLYESKLLLFRFSSKVHTMSVVRANNRGVPVQEDLKMHFLGAAAQAKLLVTEELDLVNVTGLSLPPIGQDRVVFNNGGYLSSNSLFSVGQQSEISVKASYSLESVNREEGQYTTYLLGDSQQITIGERSVFNGLAHRPQVDLNFKSNSEAYFLQSRVNFRGRFQDNASSIYSSSNLNSNASLNQYDLSGIATFIRPFGNSVLKVSSNTSISSLPQRLQIKGQGTNDELSYSFISQDISLKRILSNNEVEYIKRWGFFSWVSNVGLGIRDEQLTSELYNKDRDVGDNENVTNSNYLTLSTLSLSPSLKFDNSRLFMNASLPLKLINDKFRVTPEFSIRYKLSAYWEVISSFVSSINFSEITQAYSNPIMINYRTYKSGVENMSERKLNIVTLKAIYSNPLKLHNIWASFSKNFNSNELTTSYNYLDSLSSTSPMAYMHISELLYPSYSSSTSLILNYTKSFFDYPLLISLKLTGIDSRSQMVQQNIFTESHLRYYSALAAVDFSIGSSTDLEIRLPYSQANRESVTGIKASSLVRAFNPSFNAVLKISKKTRVAFNTTLNVNELSANKFYTYPFADIKIRIALKKGELFAEATNIFDSREYRYKIEGDLFTTEMLYKLRPFSFIAGFTFSF